MDNRTVVSKQAEFEKAVFAKTARVNARGDGKRKERRGKERRANDVFPPLSLSLDPLRLTTTPLSLKKLEFRKIPFPLSSRDHAPRRRGRALQGERSSRDEREENQKALSCASSKPLTTTEKKKKTRPKKNPHQKQTLGDLTFYVVGGLDENEVLLSTVLSAFYESVSLLLR